MKRGGIGLALVVAATVLFYLGLFVVRPLLSAMVLRMPENYEYLARRHFDREEFDRAIEACRREIARYPYNFRARFRLVEILHRCGRSEDALQELWQMPSRYQAIRGRDDVPSRGWDEARVHITLAEILWDLGRHEESLDELQMALDWADPKVDEQCEEFVARIQLIRDERIKPWALVAQLIKDPLAPLDRIPEGVLFRHYKPPPNFYTRLSQIALGRDQRETARRMNDKELINHPRAMASLLSHREFVDQFPPPANWRGVPAPPDLTKRIYKLSLGRITYPHQTSSTLYSANAAWCRFYRSTAIRGVARPWRQTKGACIVARATPCDGIWPIVSLRYNGRIVSRRYIRSAFYQVYAAPLVVPPGYQHFEVGFENDDSNRFTGQDRNVEITGIFLF